MAVSPMMTGAAFLRAARCEAADVTPVWFMRQAGPGDVVGDTPEELRR